MKTTIIEDLEMPEDRREVLSLEALRLGKPVNQLVKDWLLEKADQIIAANQKPKTKAA